ncbi:hypothetical protein GCM10007352_05280 [Mucilaginibacter phyllosphaerae]|nr:hypothetical protein GCM10007352_05280 [Mucilaginibacter phyllosphaerae]
MAPVHHNHTAFYRAFHNHGTRGGGANMGPYYYLCFCTFNAQKGNNRYG